MVGLDRFEGRVSLYLVDPDGFDIVAKLVVRII